MCICVCMYDTRARDARTREHIEIRPRRFSRRGEQNFNDPRYQSRDERVSTDRPAVRSTDQLRGIPSPRCSLTLHEAGARYSAPRISRGEITDLIAAGGDGQAPARTLSVFFHSRRISLFARSLSRRYRPPRSLTTDPHDYEDANRARRVFSTAPPLFFSRITSTAPVSIDPTCARLLFRRGTCV